MMKKSYEILSPSFMKYAGFFVSIYLCLNCLRLFVLNSRHVYQSESAGSVFLVWVIVLGAFVMCAFFAAFIFMKTDNSRIYLWNMYMLYCMKFIILLFVFHTQSRHLIRLNLLLKIVLCFGFLFMFLEFLHAQTSQNFARDICVSSVVMGIMSCVVPMLFEFKTIVRGEFGGVCFLVFYVFYALRIFKFHLLKKEVKTSRLFEYSLIVILLLLSLSTATGYFGSYYYTLETMVFIEVFVVYGCVRFISSICDNIDINSARFEAIIKGIFMLVCRFTYLTSLALIIANIWRRSW